MLRVAIGCLVTGSLLVAVPVRAQIPPTASLPPPAAVLPPKDTLGRDTPRGTVLGFIGAAREGRIEVARLYLDTRLRDKAANELVQQLYVVLDRRLSTRLNEISDRPEGSGANVFQPEQDNVGTIKTATGTLELVVERVNRGALGPVWLFSRKTLDAIPDVYEELDVNRVSIDQVLPYFLTYRVAGIRIVGWIALGLLVPLGFRVTDLFGRLVGLGLISWRRRRGLSGRPIVDGRAPRFVALLLLAFLVRWIVTALELSLRERRVWSAFAALLFISGVAWAMLRVNVAVERYVGRRWYRTGRGELTAMLGLLRRMADGVVIAVCGLIILNYFGVNPTAALAGLGIGGIAVALAAQKTLENVIGGLSIIFDKAVRVGDFLKLGDTSGTVDSVGLRSTRIRTLDRTILSVPNGQVANANIETISDRDKFWFRHILGLRLDTSSEQLRLAMDAIRAFMIAHPAIDQADTVRVRFFRVAPSSLDVDLFAYVLAPNWEQFLETQQELLLNVLSILERSGVVLAFPTQTLHLDDNRQMPADLFGASPTVARKP